MKIWYKRIFSNFLLMVTTLLPVVLISADADPVVAATGNHLSVKRPSLAFRIARASWYGPGFFFRMRADGRRYGKNDVFVAHRTLPFGTRLRVINMENRRSMIVKVEDRGPAYDSGRDFDFSWRAAEMLGMTDRGVTTVAYEVLH